MKHVRFLVLLLAFSLCLMCVCFADDGSDGTVSADGESGTEFTEVSDDNSDDGSFLDNGELAVDVLTVNDLIIEGEDEAAAAEVYSIVPNVQYGAYFHADISDFGECYIYIPVAYASDSFSFNSDGIPINITQSSITGYIAGENSNQSIQFPAFGLPRYRVSNNYDYEYITSWDDIDSTVSVYTSEDNFYSYSEVYFLRFVVLLLAADLVLNFFVRLLGGVGK